jgi:hypothetical protein
MVEKYRSRMIPRAQKAYELYVKNYGGMAGAYPHIKPRPDSESPIATSATAQLLDT